MDKLTVFIIVFLFSMGISGLYWYIIKVFARVGVWAIPLLMGLLAAWIADDGSNLLNMTLTVAFISLGVIGSLLCYLHSDLFKLETRNKKMERTISVTIQRYCKQQLI